MALGIFARAAAAGLAKLGEPSLLDEQPCGNVNIERNVELFAGMLGNADDNHVVRKDVATILQQYSPRTGAVLAHPDGLFVLDRQIDADGYRRRYVVRGIDRTAVLASAALAWAVEP